MCFSSSFSRLRGFFRAESFPNGIRFADAADLAVGNSPDLKNEYTQNRIRERAWTLGRRAYFPALTFTADENDSLSLVSTDSFQKSYSVRIERLIFDGGKLMQSRKITRAYIAAQDAAIERMKREIADKSISAYRQTLYTRVALAIKKRGLKRLLNSGKSWFWKLSLAGRCQSTWLRLI
ncbi:MAG: TolC family protein [Treponema sp.]|jgi:outer membrane protein TolC|nr:TolC family protein [Treponema sp.]